MRHARFRRRKTLASGGLLIACLLQFCGCETVQPIGVPFVVAAAILPRVPVRICDECSPLAETADGNVPIAARPELVSVGRPSNGTALPVRIDAMRLASPGVSTSFEDRMLTLEDLPWNDPRMGLSSAYAAPKSLLLPIPESVFFIYSGDASSPAVSATAFVLSVPDAAHRHVIRFLVTTRHVVDPEWAQCGEKNPTSIRVRLNRRGGGVGYETVPLKAGHARRFFVPSDGHADLAIFVLNHHLIRNLDAYKVIDVPFRLLPTEAEIETIEANQQIATAGLRGEITPGSANYPVSDLGTLSATPSGPLKAGCGTSAGLDSRHLSFMNASIPQSVSGAPVYTSLTRSEGGGGTPVLLGIQSVAWPEIGVAGFTPGAALGELVKTTLQQTHAQMDFYRGAGD